MALFTLILTVALLFVVHRINRANETLRGITESYVEWQQSANDLLIAADYLTDQTLYYTLTGSQQYLDSFFTEYLEVQRSERAVESMRGMLSGTRAFAHIVKAKSQAAFLAEVSVNSSNVTVSVSSSNVT